MSACGFKKMIYLAQYRQAGIKIIPEIKIIVVCFAGGHGLFLFYDFSKLYKRVFWASQALNLGSGRPDVRRGIVLYIGNDVW